MAQPQQQEPASRWDGVLRRSLDCSVKAFDEAGRWVDVVASTDTLDGHGDIVEQSFDLKRYKKNPVVLFLHNQFGCFDGSRPEDFLPIGRGDNVKVAGGQLEARIYFASEKASPLAERIFHQFKEGSLNAVSIGFKPGKVTRTENADTGKVTYRLANNELFEISVVPIPSNPDAVAKSLHEQEQAFFKSIAASAADPTEGNPHMAMTAEEQKALTDAQAAKAIAETALTSERTKSVQLETELATERENNKKLKAEIEPLTKRAQEAESKLIAAEVDALVGKKIQPTQREEFIELRSAYGEKKFAAFVAKMSDLPTLKGIVKDDDDTENHAKSGGTPKKIAARLEKVGS